MKPKEKPLEMPKQPIFPVIVAFYGKSIYD